IQDALHGKILGFSLPLIGDKLADGANFIGDFRTGFLANFRDQVEKLSDPSENGVKDILFNLLGKQGLKLLLKKDANGNALKDDDGHFVPGAEADIQSFNNLATATNIDDAEIWWKMKLGQNLADVGKDIGFDLGVPGLGLKTEGQIHLDIDWQLDLGFGLSGR